MTNQLARINETGIEIRNTNDLGIAVEMIVSSELCPKQYRNRPKDAMIAILAGRQVGFGPIQSLANIAVVNGRASMYGDGPTSLANGSGKVDWIKEWWELDGKATQEPNYTKLTDYPPSLTACWQAQRKDNTEPSKIVRFSVSDAKAAGLWGKQGPWTQYPKRMLGCRARAWGIRDVFGDALQGISQAEEWEDMKPAKQADPLERKKIESKAIDAPEEGAGRDESDLLLNAPPEEPPVPPGTLPHSPTLAEAKVELISAVKGYVAQSGVSEPLAVNVLIGAVIAGEFGKDRKTIDTLAEVDQVRSAILRGRYDLETGNRIPE